MLVYIFEFLSLHYGLTKLFHLQDFLNEFVGYTKYDDVKIDDVEIEPSDVSKLYHLVNFYVYIILINCNHYFFLT